VKVRPSAGGVRAENDEEVSRQLYSWNALWTHISKLLLKLWRIMSKVLCPHVSVPKQSPTEEKVSARGQEMKESTLHVPEPVFALKYPNTMRHSRSGPGELGNIFETPVREKASSTLAPASLIGSSQMTNARLSRGAAGEVIHV
jgi:hypothetical protein